MKNLTKRVASFALSLAMILSCMTGIFATLDFSVRATDKQVESLTLGQIIAKNYQFLSEKEKTILSCSALIGDSYTINYPDDSDKLIKIDAGKKTVKAENYTDGDYVWLPVAAKVIYKDENGADKSIVVELDENGYAEFSCPSDRYRVEVDYELSVEVSETLQATLLNAPAYLVEGVNNLNTLSKLIGVLDELADNMPAIYSFIDGYKRDMGAFEIELKLDDSVDGGVASRAIKVLYDECQANGNRFVLSGLLKDYNNAPNKVQYLFEHGAEVKAANEKTCQCIEDICASDSSFRELVKNIEWWWKMLGNQSGVSDDDKEFIKSNLDKAQAGLSVLERTLSGNMIPVKNSKWSALKVQIVKDNASQEELDTLDKEVREAKTSDVSEYNDVTISKKVLIGKTSVSAGIDQYKVIVTVKANVINKYSENSNELSELLEKATTSFVLDKDTSKNAIIALIDESGVKEEALELWDAYYNIGAENYEVVIEGLEDTLKADTTCVVKYVPKDYAVVYKYDSSSNMTVKYGYNIRLPKHPDASKSYDYTVNGVLCREDTLYRVVGKTEISRKEGAATTKYRVPVVIAGSFAPGASLSAEEKAVLEADAFVEENIWYRVPSMASGLAHVSIIDAAAGKYAVSAVSYASGLLSGNEWIAVRGNVCDANNNVLSTFEIVDGKGEFVSDGFDHIAITYSLNVSDVSTFDVSKWANLPNILATEAKSQLENMNWLYDNLQSGLTKVDGKVINILNGMSSEYSEAAQEAIRKINAEAVDENADGKPLYLLEYLNEYKARGLAYYYENGNAAKIEYQVKLLSECLDIIWQDDKFQEDLSGSFEEYKSRLDDVRVKLHGRTFVPVNEAINQGSAYIGALSNAVIAAMGDGKTSYHSANELVLQDSITAVAPDRVNISISVSVVSSKGGTVKGPVYGSRSFPATAVLTEADVAELVSILEGLENSLGVDKAHYVRNGGGLPVAGDVASNLNITYVWAPMSYVVRIEGVEGEQKLYADSTLAITLPACEVANSKYRYKIGGKTIDVGSTAGSYVIKDLAELDSLANSEGVIVITRELVDVYREEILKLVDAINAEVVKAGLVFGRNGQSNPLAAIIPYEDANGNITLVLRVSPAGFSTDDLLNFVTGFATVVTTSYFDYIGLDENAFWNGKVNLQSVVDMFQNSDFGFDSICNIIDANGNLKEITSEKPELASLKPIGAVDGKIKVNGSYINDLDLLGAKLIETSMQFGASDSDFNNIPFYITMEDFDREASKLLKLKKAIGKVNGYANINCKDGKFDISVRLPQSVYPYYLAAHSMPGKVELKDIYDIDIADTLGYDVDFFRDLLTNKEFTVETIERTLEKLGVSKDLFEFGGMFNLARKVADYMLTNAKVEAESEGNVMTGTVSMPVRDLLVKAGVPENLLVFVAEADASGEGLKADFSVEVVNLGIKYDAMVVDYNASGLGKLSFTTDLASALEAAGKNSVIVLLSDVDLTKDVVLNKRVVIDLNGKNLNGNIKANVSGGNDSVFIIDSSIGSLNAGLVTGNLSGAFIITGGRFNTDISAMLKEGYFQNNDGYVVNKLYVIEEDANGDITVSLSPELLNGQTKPNVKAFAIDMVADLVINMYATASVKIEGNTIYAVNINDVLDYIGKPLSNAANDAIDCADLAGISAFVNQMLADLTDFSAMADAISKDQPIVSYVVETSAWDLKLSVEGEADDNYVRVDILPIDESKKRVVNVKLDSGVSSEIKNSIINLLNEFDEIVSIEELYVMLNDINYANKSISVDGHAAAKVTLDLNKYNSDYAVIIAAAVAYVVPTEYKDELVEGINYYIECGSTSKLKPALDKVTSAQAVTAIKSLKNHSFEEIFSSIGIELDSALSLAMVYDDLVNVAAAVLNKLGITGGGRTLGSLENREFGEYGFERENWHKCDIVLTVKLFSEEKAVVVKNSIGQVYLTTDDLALAFTTAKNGDTVYVNKSVKLESGVTVTKSFEIVGGSNVDMNGNKITVNDPEAKITVDVQLGLDSFATELEGYKVVENVVDGKYVYSLEKIPPRVFPIVIIDSEGNKKAEYEKENLAEALENADNSDTVVINESVKLLRDADVSKAIKIDNASKIDMNGFVINLTAIPAQVSADAEMGADNFVSKVEEYEVYSEESGDRFVYGLKKIIVPIEIVDGGEVVGKYSASQLAEALEAAEDGQTVRINVDVTLERDANVKNVISLENAYRISMNGKKIYLADIGAKLTSDYSLLAGTVASAVEFYEVNVENVGSKYVYTLTPKPVELSAPTVDTQPDGLIRGSRVDYDKKYIIIDVSPEGLAAKNVSLIIFTASNSETIEKKIYDAKGEVERGEEDLICTGDILKVKASNPAGMYAEAEYTVIVLGDVNCDGRYSASDSAKIASYIVDLIDDFSEIEFIAADMNCDGYITVSDPAMDAAKYVFWEDYESKLK